MLTWLRRLLVPQFAADPAPASEPASAESPGWEPHLDQGQSPELAPIRWIEADDAENPFPGQGLRVLDCRSSALTQFSVTSDRAIAQRFVDLRTSDGREVYGQLPQPCLTIDCELHFPYPGTHSDGPLYRAREMEEKWYFDVHDHRLYLRRSWTGQLLHVAELDFQPHIVRIHRLHSQIGVVESHPAYAQAVVRFLIHSHLGGPRLPFPIPARLAHHTPEDLAAYAFNHYGRKGLWGVVV